MYREGRRGGRGEGGEKEGKGGTCTYMYIHVYTVHVGGRGEVGGGRNLHSPECLGVPTGQLETQVKHALQGQWLPWLQLLLQVVLRRDKQYTTLQYSTVQYNTVYIHVQYSIPEYSTVQYSIPEYSTVQYSIPEYSTVQYSRVQYSTV